MLHFPPVPAFLFAIAAVLAPAGPQVERFALDGQSYTVQIEGRTVTLLDGKGNVVAPIECRGEVEVFVFKKPSPDILPSIEYDEYSVANRTYYLKAAVNQSKTLIAVVIYNANHHAIMAVVMTLPASNRGLV